MLFSFNSFALRTFFLRIRSCILSLMNWLKSIFLCSRTSLLTVSTVDSVTVGGIEVPEERGVVEDGQTSDSVEASNGEGRTKGAFRRAVKMLVGGADWQHSLLIGSCIDRGCGCWNTCRLCTVYTMILKI